MIMLYKNEDPAFLCTQKGCLLIDNTFRFRKRCTQSNAEAARAISQPEIRSCSPVTQQGSTDPKTCPHQSISTTVRMLP